MQNRKGFTLIELLIVVVIIGILAAIAIPKFAATKDKAKLAAVKSDIRNIETAEEAYFSDNQVYGDLAALSGANLFNLTIPNTGTVTPNGTAGYTANVTNATISSGNKQCTVVVGGGGANDGVIVCAP